MAYDCEKSETYLEANRVQLIEAANRGMGGRGAVVEAMFRLSETIQAQERATEHLNKLLLAFTIVIAVGTIALVVLDTGHFLPLKSPTVATVPGVISEQNRLTLGPPIGRYQVVKIEPDIWRLDTTTGDLCLELASAAETKRLGDGTLLCPQTAELVERWRQARIRTEFNKLPREQRTPERLQQMLRDEQ